jgi:formamidopyrimidine-DNA glycosylase
MPELPDITVYLEQLAPRILNQILERIVVRSPFVLRSFDPPISEAAGKRVLGFRRMGKRIVFVLEGDLFLVIHLMESDLASFAERLTSENHTLKRALTDPRLFSGIGNAYSDEILHRARMSPLAHTGRLSEEEIARLYDATRATLEDWILRLRGETGDAFPEKVTAFREGMAVHGRYQLPCPVCGSPVQRIRYADNETNYCARCQTGGRLLADRALSRLLKKDWPRSIDEVE